jgi:hypothetical protein
MYQKSFHIELEFELKKVFSGGFVINGQQCGIFRVIVVIDADLETQLKLLISGVLILLANWKAEKTFVVLGAEDILDGGKVSVQ